MSVYAVVPRSSRVRCGQSLSKKIASQRLGSTRKQAETQSDILAHPILIVGRLFVLGVTRQYVRLLI
jgi:hypothetical protein